MTYLCPINSPIKNNDMANMSYCRFQNTVSDMQDCIDQIQNADSLSDLEKDLSLQERVALRRFMRLCISVATEYEDEFNNL